jgi:hypothetical protein
MTPQSIDDALRNAGIAFGQHSSVSSSVADVIDQ